MNAETRAKEIARILRDAIVADANGKFEADDIGGRIWFTCDDSNAAVDCEVVAAAILPLITRAENDKLEEAALALSEVTVNVDQQEWRLNGELVRGPNGDTRFVAMSELRPLVGQLIKKIRELKTEGTA